MVDREDLRLVEGLRAPGMRRAPAAPGALAGQKRAGVEAGRPGTMLKSMASSMSPRNWLWSPADSAEPCPTVNCQLRLPIRKPVAS